MKKLGWLILGVLANIREPCPSPLPMLWIRDPTKGKGKAPQAVPIELLLGENPDAALTHRLQQEEQIAEAAWRG